MKIISRILKIINSKILNFIRDKINQDAKKILKLIPDLDEFVNKSNQGGAIF